VREQKREILRREREREEEGLLVICKILEACVWAFFLFFLFFLFWGGMVRGLCGDCDFFDQIFCFVLRFVLCL
jgi:hypothetical protein